MRTRHEPIPNFNLFGESGDLPDVVHCETIEARSVLTDWEFAPHRHARLHQMLLIESGGGTVRFESHTVHLAPPCFINVPTGHVHGFSFQPGTQGHVVTIAAEVLDALLHAGEGLEHTLKRPGAAPAGADASALMRQVFAEFAGRDYGRAQMLRSLTGVLAGAVARALAGAGEAGERRVDTQLAVRFQSLLEAHFIDRWSVADYADALKVSPTHLTRVMRAATGLPVSRLADERLMREARRNLAFTNLPVAAIAYALGFDDPAYFSRVFARSSGLSPRAFRARIEGA